MAGGLGLVDIDIEIGLRPTKALAQVDERGRRDDLERTSTAWGAWYHSPHEPLTPSEPHTSTVASAIQDQFVERGVRLSDGAQSGLSPYWTWVLAVHGPAILETFGTYAFVDERLLPLSPSVTYPMLDEH
jgi:hypothetical protein